MQLSTGVQKFNISIKRKERGKGEEQTGWENSRSVKKVKQLLSFGQKEQKKSIFALLFFFNTNHVELVEFSQLHLLFPRDWRERKGG